MIQGTLKRKCKSFKFKNQSKPFYKFGRMEKMKILLKQFEEFNLVSTKKVCKFHSNNFVNNQRLLYRLLKVSFNKK